MRGLTDNAIKVLEARYLRRDAERRLVETPEEMFARVARAVAGAEAAFGTAADAARREAEFLELMASLDFLPNSPTLMNAGTGLGQLSACFVLPVEDSMEGIFGAVKLMALVQRTGGGTGFSFSRLRPKGDYVASTGGEASGPASFMGIFDCATAHIKQGGRRRGANMGVLRVDHPDVMEFIRAKEDGERLTNFNISVAVTDAFRAAARDGGGHDLMNPRTGGRTATVRARDVFQAIVDAAWRTGDPGLIFLDAVNRANPTPHVGRLDATNPCGEIPLLPYESCNLGSINLAHMLREAGGRAEPDRAKLARAARTAVRFLDDVIEASRYPAPEIARVTRGNRKIGLGVMGFAEMLVRLGVPYGSEEAEVVAAEVMGAIEAEAWEASAELAAERGPYPNWKGGVHEARGRLMRNATCTAVAPTGTIGIIAGTSPSIEPLFALAYRRSHVLGEETLFEVNPLFMDALERRGADAKRIAREVVRRGRLADVEGAPEDMKRLFVTALDVPPERHLAIQAAFQRHVDNAVSKTINMPAGSRREDVARAYMSAWELGLKGVTIYRYGSAATQVMELGSGEDARGHEHAARCDPEECRL